jgi:Rrf2 family protein
MALMSRKVDYALLILSHLHDKPQGACAREIADRFHLSRSFVANILKHLCHQGFVTSHRGVKGGYVLQRAAQAISLAELLSSLDDTFHLAECNTSGEECDCVLSSICPIRGPIAEVHHRIRELLRTVTLADLFKGGPLPANRPQPDAETLICLAKPEIDW